MMKNRNLFLMLLLLSFSLTAQTYKGHRLKLISTTLEGVASFCNNPPSFGGTKVNILINNKLPEGNIYGLDFGDGYNYYYVTFSKDTRFSDEDETMNGASVGNPIDPCTVNSFKGHILYGLGTNLDQAKSNCDNLDIGDKSKVNIQLSTPLTPNKIYGLNFGEGFKYYYVFTSSSLPSSDEDFSTTTTNISGPFSCDRDGDGDGDGVPDDNDNCPNEPGPASNNGCPLGNPNLAVDLDASQVFSQCTTCFPWLDLFFNSGKRHLIANGGGGNINFNKLEIRNIGNATSNSAKVKFYFSLNNTIGSSDKLLKTINMPSRNVNSSYGIQTTINGWDINNNGGLANGNYFILVDIDTDNSNNEGTAGEADNLLVIPITYTEENITSIISPFPISRQKNTNTQFELTVYNSQGTLVIERKVANKEEEKAFIQNLPKGFYIIKNDTDTYKIVKD